MIEKAIRKTVVSFEKILKHLYAYTNLVYKQISLYAVKSVKQNLSVMESCFKCKTSMDLAKGISY